TRRTIGRGCTDAGAPTAVEVAMDAPRRSAVAEEGARLPATLRRALATELHRATHPPYETPIVVVINGLLLLACWTLLPAAVAAVLIGVHEKAPLFTVLTVLWIAVVPLGALGVANWLGIWFPYHPLPLRYRWARRHRWRPMLLRWAVLVLAPYALVPALALVV